MSHPTSSSANGPVRRVAFIGLGVMGYPMAGHLAKAGLDVTVYNRTEAKARQWVVEYGGRAAPTPREAAQGAELVLACVGNDDDLRSVTLGEQGAFAGMSKGAVLADHTTASANVARELAQVAAAAGRTFIDAPVSGGEAGAKSGKLTIMCGSDDPAEFERVAPVLGHYAVAVTRLGPVGAGQLTKMVNQICIAGVVQGLAEAINFGELAGLDMPRVLDVIGKGAAASWQMENRGKTMVENKFDFGFAVDWMRKDLGFCLDEAKRTGASLPTTALVDQFYGDVQALGGNRFDTSSLIWRLRKLRDARNQGRGASARRIVKRG
jgi:3-hydroxyisobutyrate dehydrogenase-like beta-hydroxyacid dehydrogenase